MTKMDAFACGLTTAIGDGRELGRLSMSRASRRTRPFAPVIAGERYRIQPYLEADVYPRFREYCISKDATESAVVNAALRMFFGEESDLGRLFRRLDHMSRVDERMERDLALLGQSFAAFVQQWLAVTPPSTGDVEKVRLAAKNRFQSFAGYVAGQFARGHRFLNDLAESALGPDADEQAGGESIIPRARDITGADPKRTEE